MLCIFFLLAPHGLIPSCDCNICQYISYSLSLSLSLSLPFSQFPTGYTNCMVWTSHTPVRYVETLPTEDLRPFRDTFLWVYTFSTLWIGLAAVSKIWTHLPEFACVQEWRHAHGMRCLGIPNTAHFANVINIEDARACECHVITMWSCPLH